MIRFLFYVIQAIPVLDKWQVEFQKQYDAYKLKEAEKKARTEQNTEDLQKEIGKKL